MLNAFWLTSAPDAMPESLLLMLLILSSTVSSAPSHMMSLPSRVTSALSAWPLTVRVVGTLLVSLGCT